MTYSIVHCDSVFSVKKIDQKYIFYSNFNNAYCQKSCGFDCNNIFARKIFKSLNECFADEKD